MQEDEKKLVEFIRSTFTRKFEKLSIGVSANFWSPHYMKRYGISYTLVINGLCFQFNTGDVGHVVYDAFHSHPYARDGEDRSIVKRGVFHYAINGGNKPRLRKFLKKIEPEILNR